MTKPASIPTWAVGANAAIVEPSPGKKALGWQVGELPPAEFLNWLSKTASDWFGWLQSFGPGLELDNTWNATNTFSGPGVFNGAATLNGASIFNGVNTFNGASTMNAPTAFNEACALNGAQGDTNSCLVTHLTPAARKLLWRLDANEANGRKTYLYMSPASALEIAYNCSWNGSAWVPDHAETRYFKLVLGPSGLRVQVFRGAANTQSWTDAQWTTAVEHNQGGIKWTSPSADDDGANPGPQVGIANELRAKNVCKAWGQIFLGSTPQVNDGFNVASARFTDRYTLRVDFAVPFANENYVLLTTDSRYLPNTDPIFTVIMARLPSYFTMQRTWTDFRNQGYGKVALDGTYIEFGFAAFGQQNT